MIIVNLDVMMARRKMSLSRALDCTPGDILEHRPDPD